MRVNWGMSSADEIDGYERTQFEPYDGDPPPNNKAFRYLIKKLQFVAPDDKGGHPQLRVGLELKPRTASEKQYEGYFIMLFLHIKDNTRFTWVPFLDAIGVNGKAFLRNTIADEQGNISKIGSWANNGKQYIMVQLKDRMGNDGVTRKEANWFGPVKNDSAGDDASDSDWDGEDEEEDELTDDADDEFDDNDEYDDADDDDDWE